MPRRFLEEPTRWRRVDFGSFRCSAGRRRAWLLDGGLDARYVRAAAVLEGVDLFDASFFDMSARDAQITDPQHRLFLECAWHALENAGCDPFRFQGEMGVFAGAARNSYFVQNISRDEMLQEALDDYQIMIGSENDYLATRVAFKLDSTRTSHDRPDGMFYVTGGRAHGVSESSKLGSAKWPWRAAFPSEFRRRPVIFIRRAECILRTDIRVLSMRTLGGRFLVRGSESIVLKPLQNALADGDPIRAVIRGSAVNNDGASKSGFTAPSAPRQAAAIAKRSPRRASPQMRSTTSRRTERALKKATRLKSRRSD